ncbi:MAG: hypothetical protein WBB23_19605 [Desulforhopalus sp.]
MHPDGGKLEFVSRRAGASAHAPYPLVPNNATGYHQTRLLTDENLLFIINYIQIGEPSCMSRHCQSQQSEWRQFRHIARSTARHPYTRFLMNEAFIGPTGELVAHWVLADLPDLQVTSTLFKGYNLSGFRVGYAVLKNVGIC